MKKFVPLDGNDLVVGNIITKQEYTQNKIKYDMKFNVKEMHNKIFLLEKNFKSKIFLSSYLFSIKEVLNINIGVVLIADFQNNNTVLLLGTLDNPIDVKSLLKLDFTLDKFYENNLLGFENWLKFFADINTNIYVITNSVKKTKALIAEQNLDNYTFKYINKESISKINSNTKPFFIKEDLLSIYIPPVVISIVFIFLMSIFSEMKISSDIETSKEIKKEKTAELSGKTQRLNDLNNNEFYKNKEYYLKLVESKVYIRNKENIQ